MKKILIIGGGSIGERHVRCFGRTARAEVALCEPRAEVRQRVVHEYALRESFEQLDDVPLERFDAAVVCAPAHLHVSMAMRLAEAGRGILIEKPLSVSLEGTDALAALAADRNLAVAVAYVTRLHPALRAMKDAVDAGRFGAPVEIVAVSGQHFPYYRPAYRDTYYTRHETGGGAIQDAITHVINAGEWLVGPIDRLVADATHGVLPDVDVEDTVHMLTRHGNVLGSFSLNQHQSVNESTLTVVCERGIARLESHRNRWLSAIEPGADWNLEAEFDLERDDLFVAQATAFLDQLDAPSAPVCSLAEGVQTLKVNLAALESARTGTWITL